MSLSNLAGAFGAGLLGAAQVGQQNKAREAQERAERMRVQAMKEIEGMRGQNALDLADKQGANQLAAINATGDQRLRSQSRESLLASDPSLAVYANPETAAGQLKNPLELQNEQINSRVQMWMDADPNMTKIEALERAMGYQPQMPRGGGGGGGNTEPPVSPDKRREEALKQWEGLIELRKGSPEGIMAQLVINSQLLGDEEGAKRINNRVVNANNALDELDRFERNLLRIISGTFEEDPINKTLSRNQ